MGFVLSMASRARANQNEMHEQPKFRPVCCAPMSVKLRPCGKSCGGKIAWHKEATWSLYQLLVAFVCDFFDRQAQFVNGGHLAATPIGMTRSEMHRWAVGTPTFDISGSHADLQTKVSQAKVILFNTAFVVTVNMADLLLECLLYTKKGLPGKNEETSKLRAPTPQLLGQVWHTSRRLSLSGHTFVHEVSRACVKTSGTPAKNVDSLHNNLASPSHLAGSQQEMRNG